MTDERVERLISTLRDSCSRGPGLCDTHGDAIEGARSLERELAEYERSMTATREVVEAARAHRRAVREWLVHPSVGMEQLARRTGSALDNALSHHDEEAQLT